MMQWQAIGRYGKTGDTFLVCGGETKLDCLIALKDYAENIEYKDLAEIDSIWLEQWSDKTAFNPGRWVPWKEADLKRYRLRAATIAANAGCEIAQKWLFDMEMFEQDRERPRAGMRRRAGINQSTETRPEFRQESLFGEMEAEGEQVEHEQDVECFAASVGA